MQRSPAWDRPETRHSYAAYRLGALRWLGGGLGCAALAVGLSAYAVLVLKRPGLGVFIVAAAILAIIGFGAGVGGLLRTQRFRRALQRAPWQRAELRVAGPHLRLVFAAADVGEDVAANVGTDVGADVGADVGTAQEEARSVDVRLMATSRWRVRRVVGYRDSEVLVCPARNGSYVLTAQGMNDLYGLLPLRRPVGRYRP